MSATPSADEGRVRPPVRAALTIAGSDSGGGAGIQADLKTFAALGVYGTSAITAVTAQNTVGVTAAYSLPADLVTAQIEAVASDIQLHATKTGMLGNAAIVEAVVAAIDELELPLVVVDPVMIAKSGDRLVDADGMNAICAELLPRALVVTPNLPEAEVLSGLTIRSLDDAREAARRIHGMGPSVLIKGGHGNGDDLVDLLYHDGVFVPFHTVRIQTRHTHGTGCTFASAVAAHL
ncbi:MAG: bifunctional hydroxymethylpyrimidine kinase/phosphomethylpyrimidine kinase, partial [Vicinamibacterales bacterium]